MEAKVTVQDPYRPEDYDERLSSLEWQVAQHEKLSDLLPAAMVTTLSFTAASFCFTAVLSWLLPFMGEKTVIGITAVVGIIIPLMFAVEACTSWQERKALKAIREETTEVPVNSQAWHVMENLSFALRSLPRARREELRPLWEQAYETSQLFDTLPDDRRILQRLQARLTAVQQIVKEEEALKEASARQEKVLKQQEALLSLSEANDDDLILAKNMAEGLKEGQKILKKYEIS